MRFVRRAFPAAAFAAAAVCAAFGPVLRAPHGAAALAFGSPSPSPSPSPTPSPSPVPVPLPSGLDADQVFLRARQVATSRTAPRFVVYRIDSTFHHKAKTFVDGFNLRYRNHDAKVVGFTVPLSPEEDRKRNAGINIAIFIIPIETNPDHEPVTIDVPLLSPITTFGLAVAPPAPAPGATTAPDTGPLRTIGRTVSATHEYDVRYIGEDPVDERMLYHLTLVPAKGTKDQSSHRLRDVWVDPDTFAVPKMRVAGILGERPYDRETWTVTYQTQGGDAWVIRSVSTDDDLRFGDFIDETTVGGMTFAFHNYDFPTEIAPVMFDLAIP